MGIFDKLGSILSGNKSAEVETVKGPSSVLRENGIDPSNLDFTFKSDGCIGVAGNAASQSECDRILEVLGKIPNVKGVENNMIVGEPQPSVVPEAEAAVVDDEEVLFEEVETASTYTVQSGDTLWAIAEKMYGSGNKYMKIFEANSDTLKNPDKIYPGQELIIPDAGEQ